jgi:hypothetical protein
MLEFATHDHKYEHSTSPRRAVVAAASRHLIDVAIDINAAAETLLSVVELCEHVIHITSLMMTSFWVVV